jgi:hypothetical protein
MVAEPENELVRRVRDAAIQLRYMLPWIEDRRFENAGGRIIYAVDADVFYSYGAPGERAGIELGQVFFDDDHELGAALAQRLADHIFFRASPDMPLLIAPPIEMDVASILNRLVSQFGLNPPAMKQHDVDGLQANMDKVRKTGVLNADRDLIYQLVLRLLYLQTGAAATYRALTRLISLDRIAGPDAIGRFDGNSDVLRKTLRPFENLGDIYDHLSLRDHWSAKFKEHEDLGHKREEARTRDADCLARIGIWNRQLERSNIKILYITATPAIHELGLRYKSEMSFIRHPRYFLASEAVFQDLHTADLPTTESAFFGWLHTFVGNMSTVKRFEERWPSRLNKPFVEAVLRAEELRPGSSAEIKDRWTRFTREFREAYRPPREIEEQLTAELGALANGATTVNQWNSLRDSLNEQILRLTKDAWNDCFFVTTRTGFTVRSEAPLQQSMPARVVVPVYFDSWPKTRKFIQSVARWHQPSDFDPQQYEQGLADVQEEDPTDYAYYLAHAALFSGRGEWRTAAALCDQAIAVVSTRRESKETHANGREAHYLGGYCRRQTVRQRRELDDLRYYVRRAREIYAEERETRPALDAVGERFESEEMSIELTELMFERYADDEKDARILIAANDLLSSIVDLKDRLVVRIVELERLPGEPDAARRVDAAKQLLGRIDANIISLNLCFNESGCAEAKEFQKSYAELIEYTRSEDHGGKEIGKSFFIRSVLLTAAVTLGASSLRKREIEEHFIKAAANRVFPYDSARFSHWRTIALSMVGQREQFRS